MARALRIEGAGFWYHVMCRGNGGQRVYADKKDREAFLKRLGSGAHATMGEIGKAMGGISRSAVSMAWRRIARRSKRDKHLKRTLMRLS